MSIAILVASYPGDQAWSQFARAYQALDESLDSVAAARLGDGSTRWMEAPIPALEGLSPRQVLAAKPSGELAVRTVIMRMP
ncbi:hypothetical protein [Sphingobium ummariense]